MIELLALMLAATTIVQSAGQPAAKPPAGDEVVHIDGKKNPELIPEWSAWEAALTAISVGPRVLPDTLVPHFSQAGTAGLLQAADAHVKNEAGYHERVKRLQLLVGKETAEQIRERNRSITLEYRWEILHARDRLLQALDPAGQAALRQFVESFKHGTTVTILRKDLPFFLQPQ